MPVLADSIGDKTEAWWEYMSHQKQHENKEY